MKIGLALGGGGAISLAHLALLEQLEKEEIKINEISASSAGSVIGLLYIAVGTKGIKEFITEAKDKVFSTKKLIKTANTAKTYDEFKKLTKEYVKQNDIQKLDIKLSVVVTNISNGKMEVIESGDPVAAVLASSAYPGVFPVQKIGDNYYIDGGVTRKLPTDVLKEHKNDFVIASSLGRLKEVKKNKWSRAEVAARSIEITHFEFESEQAEKADYIFHPVFENYRWYRFDKFDDILKKSREEAKEHIIKIKKAIDNKDKIFGII